MRGELQWAGGRECEWSFLSHEFAYFKGLGITKEDLVEDGVRVVSYGQIHAKYNDGVHLKRELLRYIPRELTVGYESSRLRRGDIVFADTSEDYEGAGNCVLVDTDDEVYAGYHTIVARPRNPTMAPYYAWMFQSSSWRGQIQSKLCGIKVFSITRKILKGVSVINASENIQRRIVAYLDEKTAAIDGKVAVLEKKLAAYQRLKKSIINQAVTRGVDAEGNDLCDLRDLCARKNSSRGERRERRAMKDSGVDWIGQVPEGWSMRRVSDLVSDRLGGEWGSDADDDSNGCICLRIADFDFSRGVFKCKRLDEYTYRKYSDEKFGELKLRKGDVLVEKSGGGDVYPVGRAVRFDLPINAAYANFMDRLRANESIVDASYLLYQWNVMYSSRLTYSYLKQTTGIQNLQLTRLLHEVSFVVPPLAEQQAIADYLDAECAKIDRAAEIVTKQIDAYKRLKRSLINEVVTGKRKVA